MILSSLLSNTSIGDEGAEAIAEALKEVSVTSIIDLDNNNIGDNGKAALIKGLEKNFITTDLGYTYLLDPKINEFMKRNCGFFQAAVQDFHTKEHLTKTQYQTLNAHFSLKILLYQAFNVPYYLESSHNFVNRQIQQYTNAKNIKQDLDEVLQGFSFNKLPIDISREIVGYLTLEEKSALLAAVVLGPLSLTEYYFRGEISYSDEVEKALASILEALSIKENLPVLTALESNKNRILISKVISNAINKVVKLDQITNNLENILEHEVIKAFVLDHPTIAILGYLLTLPNKGITKAIEIMDNPEYKLVLDQNPKEITTLIKASLDHDSELNVPLFTNQITTSLNTVIDISRACYDPTKENIYKVFYDRATS